MTNRIEMQTNLEVVEMSHEENAIAREFAVVPFVRFFELEGQRLKKRSTYE